MGRYSHHVIIHFELLHLSLAAAYMAMSAESQEPKPKYKKLWAGWSPSRGKVVSSSSDSVHTVFYLYNNSATIHIHLYKNPIYSDHIRERAST